MIRLARLLRLPSGWVSNPTTGLANRAALAESGEGIGRREFTRRIFAIGAGFAVGGELIRQVDPMVAFRRHMDDHRAAAFDLDEAMRRIYTQPLITSFITQEEIYYHALMTRLGETYVIRGSRNHGKTNAIRSALRLVAG